MTPLSVSYSSVIGNSPLNRRIKVLNSIGLVKDEFLSQIYHKVYLYGYLQFGLLETIFLQNLFYIIEMSCMIQQQH